MKYISDKASISKLIVETFSFLAISLFLYILYNLILFVILFNGEPFDLNIYFGGIARFFIFYLKYLFSLLKFGAITLNILLFIFFKSKYFLRMLVIMLYIVLLMFINEKIIVLSLLLHVLLGSLIVNKFISKR